MPAARRWLLLANATALLLSESSRGLVLSSLFGLAAQAAVGSSVSGDALLGYAVAAFSAGRLAASFALTAVAARGVPYARILVVCFAIQAAGGALYVLSGSANGGAAAGLLVFSRLVVGFGSGTLPTCRAVVADVTAPAERMHAFAVLSFAKYAGYALVPGAGVFFGEGFLVPGLVGIALALAGWAIVAVAFDKGLAAAKTGSAAAGAAVQAPSGAAPASAGALWQRFSQSPAALTFFVFLGVNVVTKGVLASAEAFLAPAFTAANAASAGASAPDADPVADTAEFALALGAVGLLAYGLMACKPQRLKDSSASTSSSAPTGARTAAGAGVITSASASASPELTAAPSSAAAPAPVQADGGTSTSAPLLPAERPLAELYAAALLGRRRQLQRPIVAGGGGHWRNVCLEWARAYADELDVLLLLIALSLTAIGVGVLALAGAGGRELSLAELSFALVLLWSLAAPIADVLSVSCLSVALSLLAPGSQALMMGWLSAGGSVGRILWPLGVAWLGRGLSNTASAIATLACAAAIAALYRAFPFLPGAGALHGTLCGAVTADEGEPDAEDRARAAAEAAADAETGWGGAGFVAAAAGPLAIRG